MENIQFVKRPRLRNPYLIVAWPGMGEVAFRAASYLVESLRAEELAHIAPGEFFYLTGSVISDGILNIPQLPQSTFYYWKNKTGANDIIIFLSNAQPDLAKAENYSRQILQIAKALHVTMVVSLASMPQAIDHTQTPSVWATATSDTLKDMLKKSDLNMLNEGTISGMNGLFLGIAKRSGMNGFCLLGEIPLYTIQIENPKASHAVLQALTKILGIEADLSGLLEQSQAMEGEINKLLGYLKLGQPGQAGPINEEEIEKIKKTLGQLTRLPGSVKEKIEKLFDEAGADIAKAQELKVELDRWNVYKEYEDRFLDLFRRKQGNEN